MLSHAIARFIELQQAAGYKFQAQKRDLKSFGVFADARRDEYVRVDHALEWASAARSPRASRRRLLVIRRFALAMRAEDTRHEVAPADAFGQARYQRRNPYIYTADEILSLLTAAARLGPPNSLRPKMYPVLFGLIAATGIRISEALSLRNSDITDDGLIIRESKNRKSRLIPLHRTTQEVLRAYLSVRAALATPHDALFVLDSGKVLATDVAEYTFRTLARSIGLIGASDRPHPRIHDLRHSFAVRSLVRCPPDGNAVARHIVALSTYLGHVHVRHTYWYLQATPLLMTQIADAGEKLHHGGAL